MIICADDYGMSPDIDRAIILLCHGSKLSAVSCMVLFERFDRFPVRNLLEFQGQVDIGLHLCLTRERQPVLAGIRAAPEFKDLLLNSMLGRIAPRVILDQIKIQYNMFLDKFGRAPDFIDSHMHVHQLPVISRELIDFVQDLPQENRPYIRNTYLPLRQLLRFRLPLLKATLIGAFGLILKKSLMSRNIPTNTGFAGIYDFNSCCRYGKLFPRFCACLERENSILVTHPGFEEVWRNCEFTVLQGINSHSNRFQR